MGLFVNIKTAVKPLLNMCSDGMARHREYLKEKNEQARLEQKRQQLAQAQAMAQAIDRENICSYADFGRRVLLRCVADSYKNAELSPPGKSIEAHMAPAGERIVVLPRFGVCYCYDFTRHMDLRGSIALGFERVYTALSVRDIVGVLNQTLGNYSLLAGYGPAQIIDAVDLPQNGRVRFTVGRLPHDGIL